MKNFRNICIAALCIVLSGCAASTASVQTSKDRGVLKEVSRRVEKAQEAGQSPVVIFDLDDTLFLVNPRKQRIMEEFVGSLYAKGLDETFSKEIEIFRNFDPEEQEYSIDETLDKMGISDNTETGQAFRKALFQHWLKHFFTNWYLQFDRPVEGAQEYVSSLAEEGATIAYLTGRNVPNMKKGTVRQLKEHSFPFGNGVYLFMKPAFEEKDAAYKDEALKEIAQLGTVVAGFENEPKNLNLIVEHFPDAIHVFLDTYHSPRPIKPRKNAVWIQDFR